VIAGRVFFVLVAAMCSLHIIKMSLSDGFSEYSYYNKQPDSLYSFLADLNPTITKFPKSGVICYIGTAQVGDSPRRYYLWTLYALAPRVVVPWGNSVFEEGRGLRAVAPSLLWTTTFNDNICSYVLEHRIDKQLPYFFNSKYVIAKYITSGNISMRLYKKAE
jgi:hypothetical protein